MPPQVLAINLSISGLTAGVQQLRQAAAAVQGLGSGGGGGGGGAGGAFPALPGMGRGYRYALRQVIRGGGPALPRASLSALAAFGLEAAAWAAAISVIVRGLHELAAAGMETGVALATARTITGGSAGAVGGIAAAAAAAGQPLAGLGGAAAAFRERLATNPLAAMRFGQAVLPRELDPGLDEARLFLRALHQVWSPLISDAQAHALAISGELQEYERFRPVAIEHARDLDRISQTMARISDASQSFTETEFAWNRIKGAFGNIGASLVPILRIPTILDQVARFMDIEAQWFAAWIPGGNKSQGNTPTDRNTAALQNLSTIILQAQGGFYGGGSRARGALPAGVRGYALRRGLETQSLHAGAFQL